MDRNILIAGVGGQGILSIAYLITQVAMREKLNVKQSEVHGMAQRGGAVLSHLRLSDLEIASDLIPKGCCDLLIGVEPLEAARYLDFLSPDGTVVTSRNPLRNIENYPDLEVVYRELQRAKKSVLLDSEALAREAGNSLAQNTVLLGASSRFLSFSDTLFEDLLGELWKTKGARVVDANLKAFRLGREAASETPRAA